MNIEYLAKLNHLTEILHFRGKSLLYSNKDTLRSLDVYQMLVMVYLALDLKPNYVRAWANMGISYANQGMYEDSIRYYVRALAMNPKADNAWQYLRISLSCVSRNDMIEACDSRNL
nr:peroxisome biogenesis protein 5-like isoform X1 [Tanacetum cinerariifolium]